MSCPGITRQPSMRKVVTSTFIWHVYLVSIQMIMMRIFVRLVVHPSTGVPITPVVQPGLDMSAINSRFVAFKSSSSSKPYQKQKSSLERQLSSFLASLSPPKSMSSASSKDIVKFLISKDKTGRTMVHTQTCDRKVCKCPRRLAAGSVDSLIGKLLAIYNRLGRFGHVNPVSHSLIKEYLKFTREERDMSRFAPN